MKSRRESENIYDRRGVSKSKQQLCRLLLHKLDIFKYSCVLHHPMKPVRGSNPGRSLVLNLPCILHVSAKLFKFIRLSYSDTLNFYHDF